MHDMYKAQCNDTCLQVCWNTATIDSQIAALPKQVLCANGPKLTGFLLTLESFGRVICWPSGTGCEMQSYVVRLFIARAQEKQKIFSARFPIEDIEASKTKVSGSANCGST